MNDTLRRLVEQLAGTGAVIVVPPGDRDGGAFGTGIDTWPGVVAAPAGAGGPFVIFPRGTGVWSAETHIQWAPPKDVTP